MSAYQIARPTVGLPLRDNQNVVMPRHQLNGSVYTLHPRLNDFANLYNNRGELAIITKFGVPQANSGSHAEAQLHIKRGVPSGTSMVNSGWINRVASANFNDSFSVLDIAGGTPTTLDGAFKPLALRNLTNYGISGYAASEYGFRMDTAFSVIDKYIGGAQSAEQVKSWKQVETTVDSVNAAIRATTFATPFPQTSLGAQLRDIFVAFKNFGTRIGYAEIGGFDLHGQIDPQGQSQNTPMGMSARMKELNDAVMAFRINCESAGIWNNLALLTTTEFGRTNRENGTKGCDHADASVAFLLGGAVQGGHYGDAPSAEDLARPQNGVDATTSSTDVYLDIVRGAGLNETGLVPAGYLPKSLGLIRA